MAEDRKDTKGRILAAAFRLFYQHGFSRVSVDAIADMAGVTKRTVYYHFKCKDEIVTQVMEVQHLHLMEQYRSWLEPTSDTPREVVIGVFSKLKDWAGGADWLGSGFSRVSAELAEMRGHPARQAASRHKRAVERWLADRLEAAGAPEAERSAREIMLLIEGSMGLALIHGEAGYMDAAMHAAEKLVSEA
jgi:AcrR family transcriptional regulator